MNNNKIAILSQILNKFDGRIDYFTNFFDDLGFVGESLGFVSQDGYYPTTQKGKLLDWRPAAKLRMPIANIVGLVRGKNGRNIAIAAAQRSKMEKALKHNGYKYVIATDPETLLIAARAKYFGRYKLFYDAHEYFEDEVANDLARKLWVKKVHKFAANKIDCFITVNEEIAKEYAKSDPIFPSAIIIHNLSEFPPTTFDDGRLKKAADLHSEARILIYQGGLEKDRNLDKLVDAFKTPPKNWHLVIMGSGSLLNELKAQSSKHVCFLPPVPRDQLHHWTVGADLGAILYEPTCVNQLLCSPNKLWEYPAANVPILATDLPYLRSQISSNGIGSILPINFTIQELHQELEYIDIAALKVNCPKFIDKFNLKTELAQLKPYLKLN